MSLYPGDAEFTRIIDGMRVKVRSGSMSFTANGRSGMTKAALAGVLVSRHMKGNPSPPALNSGMPMTNAEWLFAQGSESELVRSCVAAMQEPASVCLLFSWKPWAGTHIGHWYSENAGSKPFVDNATWYPPAPQRSRVQEDMDASGKLRVYTHQKVIWPDRYGWNQSHAELPYVWGWDPKTNDPNDAPHLGYGFTVGKCDYIIWLTPRTAFLEGVNRKRTREVTVKGTKHTGRPKTSTALSNVHDQGGYGQWVVK